MTQDHDGSWDRCSYCGGHWYSTRQLDFDADGLRYGKCRDCGGPWVMKDLSPHAFKCGEITVPPPTIVPRAIDDGLGCSTCGSHWATCRVYLVNGVITETSSIKCQVCTGDRGDLPDFTMVTASELADVVDKVKERRAELFGRLSP